MLRCRYDVVVVGAGPAGCMAAKYAAKEGASVLIVEEDAVIGEPVQCAGLISERAIEESELKNKGNLFIENEMKSAIIYPPSPSHSDELRIEVARTPTHTHKHKRVFAIRRNIFDQLLAKEALKEGVDIKLKSKVTGINKEGGIITAGRGEKKEIMARTVIAADGVKSRVAKMAGLNVGRGFSNNNINGIKNILSCVQIEGRYKYEKDIEVEIFLGRSVAPGFFAWVIPLGKDNGDGEQIARIGLCVDRTCTKRNLDFSVNAFPKRVYPVLFLKTNLAHHPILSKKYGGGMLEFTTGAIPLGKVEKSVNIDTQKGTGMLLVGDAAAQVKPVTGGGVYYGMKCGKIAGKIAAKASLTRNVEMLKAYEKQWMKEIGKEIRFGLWVHRLRGMMSDEDFDTLCHALSQENALQRIKKQGDLDYPSIVLRNLIKNPATMKLVAKNIIKYLYRG
jgi:geranylgeranyl reductase family protein